MNTKGLELAVSKFALGLLGSEGLPQIAAEWLEHGRDTPSLRVLAGLNASELEDAPSLFQAVLSELNVLVPGKWDAVMRLAREIAVDILAGSTSAYQGATQIWELTLRALDEELTELDTFVYGASEWNERPGDRGAFEEGIVAAARDLAKD